MPSDSQDIPFHVGLTFRLRAGQGCSLDHAIWSSLLSPDGTRAPRVQILADSGVAAANPSLLWGLHQRLSAICDVVGPVHIVPGGEPIKNDWGHVQRLLGLMNDARLCRRSYVVAIGGGAVLDAVGLAAAMTHRGVRLVRVPTTTLAQADSCAAVKNGVNGFGRKNHLGVFAAPWGVIVDPDLLSTLSPEHWLAGFSEAVKVAAIKDPALFDQVETAAPAIARCDLAAAWPIIRRSLDLHVRHITAGGDPFELTHARPLDFGHWAAHKLETLTSHRLSHGHAVAIGIAIDSRYSALAGLLSSAAADRILGCLHRLGFKTADPVLADPARLMAGIEEFREHLGGRLCIAQLADIGRAVDVHQIESDAMLQAIRDVHTSHPL